MIGAPNLRSEDASEEPQPPTSRMGALILQIAQHALQGSVMLHRLEDACDRLEGGVATQTGSGAAGEPEQALEQLPIIDQLHRVALILEERNRRQLEVIDRLDNIV